MIQVIQRPVRERVDANADVCPTGKSDLTVDALKLHNELQTGSLDLSRRDAAMEEEPSEAVSERTAGTFLSGLSDCSNLTFRKVQRYWESNSAAHKEVATLVPLKCDVRRHVCRSEQYSGLEGSRLEQALKWFLMIL